MSFAATRTSRHTSGGRPAAGLLTAIPAQPGETRAQPGVQAPVTGRTSDDLATWAADGHQPTPARPASGPKEGGEQMTDQPALPAAAAGPGQAGLPVAGATARPGGSIRPAGPRPQRKDDERGACQPGRPVLDRNQGEGR